MPMVAALEPATMPRCITPLRADVAAAAGGASAATSSGGGGGPPKAYCTLGWVLAEDHLNFPAELVGVLVLFKESCLQIPQRRTAPVEAGFACSRNAHTMAMHSGASLVAFDHC